MKHVIPRAVFALLIMTSACTFDLTEVRPEARDAHFGVLIETARDSATRVSIQLDPGTTEEGVARTLVQEDVILDGVAYPPVERVEERRQYEVRVPESATSIHIMLPSITGMAEVPAFVAVPLRVLAPDTVYDNGAGILEIPILGGTDSGAFIQNHWTAILHAAGIIAPRLILTGTQLIPSVLTIPTIHLPQDVQEGSVQVTGTSVHFMPLGTPFDIVVHRTMYASVPFRIIR